MSWKLMLLLSAATLGLAANPAWADSNPLHNSANAYDVDNNRVISSDDFKLIVAQVQRQFAREVSPLVDVGAATYFWDTSNNGYVSPHDALLVANHMAITQAPEPSACVTAVFGLLGLAGYCWRRRARKQSAG